MLDRFLGSVDLEQERAELELSADESYLLMVANWWGEPEAPWELLLNVYPGSFP